MKRSVLGIVMAAAFAVSLAASGVRAQSAAAGYDFKDMPDMSDFDPATWTSPTGDTITLKLEQCRLYRSGDGRRHLVLQLE